MSEEQPPSVFGNLPASRPGVRSPRRGAEGVPGGDIPEQDLPAEPEAGEPDPPRQRAAQPETPAEAPGEGPGGLEDLAWAGVAAAAEAATLGVRLTTRAVEALRDAASRR